MTTSELSDALNPHIVQSRSWRSTVNSLSQPTVTPARPYVPHRSELELAITEPPPPPAPARPRPQPPHEGINAVQELLRIIATSKEAVEIERKRRVAWEQEQQAKFMRREAELEGQILDMRQEIASLKAYIGLFPQLLRSNNVDTLAYPRVNGSSATIEQTPSQPLSMPLSPVSQPSFVEGSSSRPYAGENTGNHEPPQFVQGSGHVAAESSPSASPSPRFPAVNVPPRQTETPSTIPVRRRRRAPDPPTDGDDESSDGESPSDVPERPLKRASHHDKRCLTIQHAIRLHVLRVMGLETDEQLPDNHIEGAPLGSEEPVRFVWEKTTKQSEHNARMKKRVLEDLKANKKLYKYVPDKDFSNKTLDAAFDQAFVTFRQKFKAQRDMSVAVTHKTKEDTKALKARRLGRKKLKLNNRTDTRKKIEAFSHATFDAALQIDCVSSEESVDEEDDFGARRVPRDKSQVLRVRGLPWRSSRLQRFYGMLDEEDKLDKSLKPKRGVGRKERCLGPPKDGLCMPPKGVASWMISRRWLHVMQTANPDFVDSLKGSITDPPGFDWDQFDALGVESDCEPQFQALCARERPNLDR